MSLLQSFFLKIISLSILIYCLSIYCNKWFREKKRETHEYSQQNRDKNR